MDVLLIAVSSLSRAQQRLSAIGSQLSASTHFVLPESRELTAESRSRADSREPVHNCGRNLPATHSFTLENRGLVRHGRSLISSLRARSSWNIASICAAMASS